MTDPAYEYKLHSRRRHVIMVRAAAEQHLDTLGRRVTCWTRYLEATSPERAREILAMLRQGAAECEVRP